VFARGDKDEAKVQEGEDRWNSNNLAPARVSEEIEGVLEM
jgi:hypothetical protein